MTRLSVVVMSFNEAQSLRPTHAEILTSCERLGIPFEIVVVDDGSTDGSEALAHELAAADQRVRVVRHPQNLGLGGVYRTGFSEAKGDLVTFFPADGQFPAEIIEHFHPRMHELDMVLGYLPRRNDALLGRFLSMAQRQLYAMMFGTVPTFQGILMFRRELLGRFPLVSEGRSWVVLMELIIRASRSGARYESVPTAVRPREHGSSKVNNWRTIRATMEQMVTLWRDMRAAR